MQITKTVKPDVPVDYVGSKASADVSSKSKRPLEGSMVS